ncbi:MAG: hypothetical protein II937_06190 [Bacteroidales bacterium]|nr:hypothetical protein [Bacteroidales bacterium]
MNKLLKIKYLAATLTVIFTLFSCNGSSNSDSKNDGNAQNKPHEAQTQEKNEDTKTPSEQVIEKQEKIDSDPEAEPIPAEEVLEAYSCPNELKYCAQNDEYLYEKFYPIGWSKNGLFAYIIEPVDEAAGLYFFKIVIRNMINDKEVWSWQPEDEPEKGSVRQMWKDYGMMFTNKLNEYKIIQQKDQKLLGSEFSYKDKKFKVLIENKLETDEDYGFEVVKGTNIFIKCPELGFKKIYSYTEKDYSLCLGKIIQGVIISPFEDRVAVLVKTEKRGYEGPPNVIEEFLVGANLVESFKK